MTQGGVLFRQALTVLRCIIVIEGPLRNIHGNWHCTLGGIAAGAEVRVDVALESGIPVITVY